jgi:hypothetical protein
VNDYGFSFPVDVFIVTSTNDEGVISIIQVLFSEPAANALTEHLAESDNQCVYAYGFQKHAVVR